MISSALSAPVFLQPLEDGSCILAAVSYSLITLANSMANSLANFMANFMANSPANFMANFLTN
jgi:hypothetical protein